MKAVVREVEGQKISRHSVSYGSESRSSFECGQRTRIHFGQRRGQQLFPI
jgi:hypothetical protein